MSLDPLTHVLDKLDAKKPSGDGWIAICPAHEDKEPSLSLKAGDDGRVLLNCFAGCAAEAIVEALGLEMKDLFPNSKETRVEPVSRAPVTLQALAKKTGLPEAFLTSLGLEERAGGVRIPFRDREGKLLHHKIRVAIDGKSKYRYEKGAKLAPYGLWRLSDAQKFNSVVLCEGESDAWTLWHHGIPALGLPGAKNYKVLEPELVMDLKSVFVIQEPDDAGEAFATGMAQRLTEAGYKGRIYVVRFSRKDKDPNQLFLQAGEGFMKRFRELCNRAPEYGATTVEDMLLCMADVKPRQVEWLWAPYIPCGFLTVIGGKPGMGKSFLTCGLAAQIASGERLPGQGEPVGPQRVILFSAEDDPETVIHRRLTGAGADEEALGRIFVFDLENHEFTFEGGSFAQLEMIIERFEPKLVIFDPFVSFASAQIDIHRQNEVRAVLAPLMRIAAKTGVAIVVVVHVKKGSVVHAIDALVGSVDFSAAVRSALLVYPDPRDADTRLVAHAKHNLTAAGETLRFSVDGGFRWNGTSEMGADELAAMAAATGERPAIEEAKRILEAELAHGRRRLTEINKIGREHGLSNTTLYRARKEMGITSKREGFGPNGVFYLEWPEEYQTEVPF